MRNVLGENFPARGGYNNFNFVCFPKSRVSWVCCWPRCAWSAEGGSNWSFKKSNQTNLAVAGMGNVANPSCAPSKGRGFLDEPPFVLNFPLFQLNKATILPALTTTAFWKCKITRSH